ncbi:MAG: hypothetical protein U9N04_01270 [Patescibacteria group bacterium]|nr:hypothetical protein [Patescibacteria group bacterium]
MVKDFYKSNKLKVILMIVIMILNIALGVFGIFSDFCIETYDGYHINDCPESSTLSKILTPFSLVLILPFAGIAFGLTSNIFLFIASIIFGITILIFFWYTLSCSIVKIKSKYFTK